MALFLHKYARTCFCPLVAYRLEAQTDAQLTSWFLLSLSNANNVQLGCLEWSTCDNWLKFNPVYQFEGLKNQILKSSLCFAKVGEICMKFLQILAPNCASNCASTEVDSVNVNSARVFGLWVVRSNCNFVKLLIIASLRNEHLKQSIFTFFFCLHYSQRGFA